MPDGTVKQIGPLTGTRVWTVPGRANRPIAAPRDTPRVLARGEAERLCAFCSTRYLETTPEKARIVGPEGTELRRVPAAALFDTVAEFRRFGNLFEIVSAEYWRENHGFRQPSSVVEWAQDYLSSPEGLALVQGELKALKHERRALRRLENLLLTALGRAPDAGVEADDDA